MAYISALFHFQTHLKYNQGHNVAGVMLPEYSEVLNYVNEHRFCNPDIKCVITERLQSSICDTPLLICLLTCPGTNDPIKLTQVPPLSENVSYSSEVNVHFVIKRLFNPSLHRISSSARLCGLESTDTTVLLFRLPSPLNNIKSNTEGT